MVSAKPLSYDESLVVVRSLGVEELTCDFAHNQLRENELTEINERYLAAYEKLKPDESNDELEQDEDNNELYKRYMEARLEYYRKKFLVDLTRAMTDLLSRDSGIAHHSLRIFVFDELKVLDRNRNAYVHSPKKGTSKYQQAFYGLLRSNASRTAQSHACVMGKKQVELFADICALFDSSKPTTMKIFINLIASILLEEAQTSPQKSDGEFAQTLTAFSQLELIRYSLIKMNLKTEKERTAFLGIFIPIAKITRENSFATALTQQLRIDYLSVALQHSGSFYRSYSRLFTIDPENTEEIRNFAEKAGLFYVDQEVTMAARTCFLEQLSVEASNSDTIWQSIITLVKEKPELTTILSWLTKNKLLREFHPEQVVTIADFLRQLEGYDHLAQIVVITAIQSELRKQQQQDMPIPVMSTEPEFADQQQQVTQNPEIAEIITILRTKSAEDLITTNTNHTMLDILWSREETNEEYKRFLSIFCSITQDACVRADYSVTNFTNDMRTLVESESIKALFSELSPALLRDCLRGTRELRALTESNPLLHFLANCKDPEHIAIALSVFQATNNSYDKIFIEMNTWLVCPSYFMLVKECGIDFTRKVGRDSRKQMFETHKARVADFKSGLIPSLNANDEKELMRRIALQDKISLMLSQVSANSYSLRFGQSSGIFFAMVAAVYDLFFGRDTELANEAAKIKQYFANLSGDLDEIRRTVEFNAQLILMAMLEAKFRPNADVIAQVRSLCNKWNEKPEKLQKNTCVFVEIISAEGSSYDKVCDVMSAALSEDAGKTVIDTRLESMISNLEDILLCIINGKFLIEVDDIDLNRYIGMAMIPSFHMNERQIHAYQITLTAVVRSSNTLEDFYKCCRNLFDKFQDIVRDSTIQILVDQSVQEIGRAAFTKAEVIRPAAPTESTAPAWEDLMYPVEPLVMKTNIVDMFD